MTSHRLLRCSRFPLVLALFVVSPGATVRGDDAGLATRVREALQKFVDDQQISGAVTLVASADRVLDVETVGLRDIGENQPMTVDTVFRIASMTKPITAIAVLMLAEEGKLSVDDPVSRHLPGFKGQAGPDNKDASRPITLRDLLTHTSGLPDSASPGVKEPAQRPRTLEEAADLYARRHLSFEPGTKWSYSNSGITTLGRIVEVVSGRPFETFLQDRLFSPLGMNDTTFYPSREELKRLATTYDRKDGTLVPVASSKDQPTRENRLPSPAGGLYSTAPDLVKLYQMMLQKGTWNGRRYLTESSVAEMTRTQTGEIKTGFTEGMSYGLGFAVVKQPKGVTGMLSPGTFGHGGAYGTQAWIDPVKDRILILMIQRVGLPNSDDSIVRRGFQAAVFDVHD